MAASRTAQYVALYRALERLETARPRLFDDPFAVAFLRPSHRLLLRAARLPAVHRWLCRYADRRAPGARTSAIARTRFIDDLVLRQVGDGVHQIVVLGAGFDCRAHRLPALGPTMFFEVDRPETQRTKRSALGDVRSAERVRYVAVDFLRDDLEAALVSAGWDGARRTLVVWEGVTNYLTERAVAGILAWIAATPATVVFTYVHAGLLDGSASFDGGERILANVRALGEPWTFGLHPNAVSAFLARSGLALSEDLGADDYRTRYLPADVDGHHGYAFYRLAVAATASRP